MLSKTLPILLIFPSIILAIVILPDADIFSVDLQESVEGLPKSPEQPLLPKSASHPETANSDDKVALAVNADPEYCGRCYAALSPPDAVKPGCCNTCAEVRKAYELLNWAFGHGWGIQQCEREGYGELLEAQRHEGVPEYTSTPYPRQTESAAVKVEAQDQRRNVLSLKHATIPQMVEEVVEESWVKITRLSPKFGSLPATTGVDDEAAEDDDDPLPVVIWHGLGDSADAPGLKDVAKLIDDVHPGTYTYLIAPTGKAGSADRQASFFGNVTEQLDYVCHALAHDNILRTAPAIDAVGFSQGGQFLRGYVQRCGSWAPPVRSLITFGSQHNGIAEFQKCASPTDWICQGANALLKSSTVWSDFVQSRLVPAQYYRDLNDYDNYLQHSNFLADINNERARKNATYVANLAALEKFVMVVFRDDQTVIPKESGWFAEVNTTSETITKLRDRPIYKEDWIGLKKLDQKGGLEFVSVAGEHMQLDDKDLKKLFGTYLGPFGKKFSDEDLLLVEQDGQFHRQDWKPEL